VRHIGAAIVAAGLSSCGVGAGADGGVVSLDAPPLPSCWAAVNATFPLELGTGEAAWESLPEEGGRAVVVRGPQGGYHIYGRVRSAAIGPDVRVSFRLRRADEPDAAVLNYDDPPARLRLGDGLAATPEGNSTGALRVIFRALSGPAEVAGMPFRFEACLQDIATLRVATTARRIVIVAAP